MTTLAASASEIRSQNRSGAKAYDQVVRQAADAAQALHAVSTRRESGLMKQQTLAERLLEDYELDLRNEPRPENLQPVEDRQEIEESITHLRSQLQKTGAVNMEALAELNRCRHVTTSCMVSIKTSPRPKIRYSGSLPRSTSIVDDCLWIRSKRFVRIFKGCIANHSAVVPRI